MIKPEVMQRLLEPISPQRVGKDGKGFSHVEAWDIRRTMNNIFGFAEWSSEVTDMELIYEVEGTVERNGKQMKVWGVSYRARCSIRVNGAVYSEWAAGDATNYPSRADAHDQAIKTAESQAFKRACVNLGDQFGLSLYNNGSTQATVQDVVGRDYADSGEVEGWIVTLGSSLHTTESLEYITVKILNADLSPADKDRLRLAYRAAKAKMESRAAKAQMESTDSGE